MKILRKNKHHVGFGGDLSTGYTAEDIAEA